MANKSLKLLAISIMATAIAGCGGGGGGSGDTADTRTAEGFYAGSTGDSRAVTAAVMQNGTYYVLYSRPGLPSTIGGFVQGSGSSSNGTYTSNSGTDFNFEGGGNIPVTVSATYQPKQSISARITAAGGSNTATGAYSAEYEKVPSLTTLAGTYSGVFQDAIGDGAATVQITAAGNVTGSTNTGCNIAGLVEPATAGNGYALGMTFSGAACPLLGLTLGGAVFFDSTAKAIYAAAFNSARTYGAVFVGTKP